MGVCVCVHPNCNSATCVKARCVIVVVRGYACVRGGGVGGRGVFLPV